MKRLLLPTLTGLVLAASSSAFAADLSAPAPASAYKAPPAAPPGNWTGFYMGANAGYGWGTANHNWTMTLLNPAVAPATVSGTDSDRFEGALGGLQAGYNWQISNFLLGLETDIQISGQRGDQTFLGTILFPNGNPSSTSTASYTDKLPWFGTLRARAGVLATERWLLYATGGLAYGQVDISGISSIPGAGFPGAPSVPPAGFNLGTTKVGWTVGGGVEGAITNNWSWKAEYLFMDLGTIGGSYTFLVNGVPCTGPASSCFNVSPGSGGTFSSRVTDSVVRLGLNYRFY